VPNETIYIERKNRVYEHNDRTFFKRQPSGIKKGDLVFMAVVSYDAQERETPIIVGDLCRDLKSDLYPTYKEHLWQILSTHHQKSHLQIHRGLREAEGFESGNLYSQAIYNF
jgi:hypothetical protein